MDARIIRFLKRKAVKPYVDDNFILNENYITDLIKIFDTYGYRKTEDYFFSIIMMIINNQPFIYRRFVRLRRLPASPTKYSLYLRYGRNYIEHYNNMCESKTKHFKTTKQYWISSGITDPDEIKNKITEYQKSIAKLSANKTRNCSDYTCRSMNYWIKNGYTQEEAKIKIKNIQTTNGIKYLMGTGLSFDEAYKKQNERNKKFLATLDSKPIEEKKLINMKKGHGIDNYILNGYSKEEAVKKSILYYSNRNNYSNMSQDFFDMLVENLKFDKEDVYYKRNNHEYQIYSKCVDFYLKSKKLVIEFYGDWWHMNPSIYKETDTCYGLTATEIWKKDEERINLIYSSSEVENIIVIWESEFKSNYMDCISKIKEYINEQY